MVAAHPYIDPTGNWTDYIQKTSGSTDLDQDRTHNKVNETTDITETTGPAWVTPVHDAAGNMTTVPRPSVPTTALPCTYDAWNRLVETDVAGPLTFKNRYDGLNRRTARKAEAGEMEAYNYFYYNASWQILEMRPASAGNPPEGAQPYYQYVWSARYIDAPVLRDCNADVDSETGDLGTSGSGLEERLYYLGDANFNVTCLVDTNGDAVERYVYDPYGVVTIYTGDWSSTRSYSSYFNVILYTGRERDTTTELYHYRNRYYHAELGRFISRDPIGYEARDVNLYRYVGNQPPTAVDPMGEGVRVPPPPPGGWRLATITACYLGCKGLNRELNDCQDCCERCGRQHSNICLKMRDLAKRGACTIAMRNSIILCGTGLCCSKPVVLPPPGGNPPPGGCEHWVGVVAMLVALLTYLGLTRRKHDCRSWE